MPHYSNRFTPLPHPVLPCTIHILPLCKLYSHTTGMVLPQGHTCASTSSSSRLLVHLFLLSGGSRSPTRFRSSSGFAKSIGPCNYVSILTVYRNPPVYLPSVLSSFTLFLSATQPFPGWFLWFLFLLPLYSPNFSMDRMSFWFGLVWGGAGGGLWSTTLATLALFGAASARLPRCPLLFVVFVFFPRHYPSKTRTQLTRKRAHPYTRRWRRRR